MEIIITFILYFLVFALIHSVLATDHVKNKVEKYTGDWFRFYRLLYNFLSVITFAPVLILWIENTSSSPLFYIIPGVLYPVFVLVRLLAAGMIAYAAYQTDFFDFIGIRHIHGKTGNKLITKGAYRLVRHPLYTGTIILLFTKMEMSFLDITAVFLISAYMVIGAFIEEKRLRSVFGDEYREYQERVSMLVPTRWISQRISQIIN